jgi:hypothetical protein
MTATISPPVLGRPGAGMVRRLKTYRGVCRSWLRQTSPIVQREIDTKLLITTLDTLEETRPLVPGEASLRRLATEAIQAIHNEKSSFWCQRCNLKMVVEWDENSRFFPLGGEWAPEEKCHSDLGKWWSRI